jgi:hypothetical protein
MSFGKCCFVTPNGNGYKQCLHSFIVSDTQIAYCNYHFNDRDLINLYSRQYVIVTNSNLPQKEKDNILNKITICLIKYFDSYVNRNNIEINNIEIMRINCSSSYECKIYSKNNKYGICIPHLVQLLECSLNLQIDNEEEKSENKNDKNNKILQKSNKPYMEKPDDCPVCFCDLNGENQPLKCGHWVHKDCIQKWKIIQKISKIKCPLCRADLE